MYSLITKLLLMFFSKIFKKKSISPPAVVDIPLKELTNDEFEEIKLKARIVFVDDEEIVHLKRLSDGGYNIHHMSDIDNIDDFLRKKYDLVVLDIQGIGKTISPDSAGWGILKHLKEVTPQSVVIMYTGADWSITKYKKIADLADDFIGKDLEYLDFKRLLDGGIKKAFSTKYQMSVLETVLEKEISNSTTIKNIKGILEKQGGDKSIALNEVKNLTNNKNVIDAINNMLNIANNVQKLFE